MAHRSLCPCWFQTKFKSADFLFLLSSAVIFCYPNPNLKLILDMTFIFPFKFQWVTVLLAKCSQNTCFLLIWRPHTMALCLTVSCQDKLSLIFSLNPVNSSFTLPPKLYFTYPNIPTSSFWLNALSGPPLLWSSSWANVMNEWTQRHAWQRQAADPSDLVFMRPFSQSFSQLQGLVLS